MAGRNAASSPEDYRAKAEDPCSGLRTFIVPPDIIPVKRRSPLPIRKRTPWHPQPDGTPTEHCGGREWFQDGMFVESHHDTDRASYLSSAVLHIGIAILLIAVLVRRPIEVVLVTPSSPIVMPATAVLLAAGDRSAPTGHSTTESAPRSAPQPTAARLGRAMAAAPIEAPPVIAPESAVQSRDAGIDGGIEGGVSAGVPGGIAGGAPGEALSGPGELGPLQVGTGGIKAPRKIKDVRPLYPKDAMSARARGAVVIEAIIGIDGKVTEARVVSSVPLLDKAALDAVRQWEYVPTVVNGSPVAVAMTIVVNFAIQ